MPEAQICRASGAPLTVVLDLGQQPLGNGFRAPDDTSAEYTYWLRCGFSEVSSLFQLIEQPDPAVMFHDAYAFRSSTSAGMRAHFQAHAERIIDERLGDRTDPFVVELGCNDGIWLRHFADRGIRHAGIEPTGEPAEAARAAGVDVVQEFFTADLGTRLRAEHGPAAVIYAANVMCHIPDIRGVADGIAALLDDDGLLVFEDPYLGDVIRLGSYDQIYDEHVFLFSALSVQAIFADAGLELIDLEPLVTHGGSMRYTLGRHGRHAPRPAVAQILEQERLQGLDRTDTYLSFAQRVRASATALLEALQRARAAGHTVAAYGATSKSTTIYAYAGITSEHIDVILDNTPNKIGLVSPGAHIPVVDEAEFQTRRPGVTFLSAWNHQREIVQRHAWYAAQGGVWLTHVPEVHEL
ncbi:MAG: class I SAM-dependent methyltransferase [Candidatus Nanopelagicales bacterium]|nr:class I SAM-dependent methyltransferase [Candidatus Nanopelagicales bacterium]